MSVRWKSTLPAVLAAVLLAGCAGPAPEVSDVSQTSSSGVEVEEHWSVLGDTQRLPAVGTRWQEGPMEELVPGADYGELVPYAGAGYYLVYQDGEGGTIQSPSLSSLYGLMTVDGCVVLDPVCTNIVQLFYTDSQGAGVDLPVWKLTQSAPAEHAPDNQVALSAGDGSWSTGFQYWAAAGSPLGIFAAGPEGLSLLDSASGVQTSFWSWESLGIDQLEIASSFQEVAPYSLAQWVAGAVYLGFLGDDWNTVYLLDPDTGLVTAVSAQTWFEQEALWYAPEEGWRVESGEDGTVTVSKGETVYTFQSPLPGDQYPYARLDRVLFQDYGEDAFAVTTLEGQTILPAQKGQLTVLEGEDSRYLAVQPEGEKDWTLYSWDGEAGETLPGAADSWCETSGPLICVHAPDNAAYYRPDTGECVFRAWFTLEDRTEGLGLEEDG